MSALVVANKFQRVHGGGGEAWRCRRRERKGGWGRLKEDVVIKC